MDTSNITIFTNGNTVTQTDMQIDPLGCAQKLKDGLISELHGKDRAEVSDAYLPKLRELKVVTEETRNYCGKDFVFFHLNLLDINCVKSKTLRSRLIEYVNNQNQSASKKAEEYITTVKTDAQKEAKLNEVKNVLGQLFKAAGDITTSEGKDNVATINLNLQKMAGEQCVVSGVSVLGMSSLAKSTREQEPAAQPGEQGKKVDSEEQQIDNAVNNVGLSGNSEKQADVKITDLETVKSHNDASSKSTEGQEPTAQPEVEQGKKVNFEEQQTDNVGSSGNSEKQAATKSIVSSSKLTKSKKVEAYEITKSLLGIAKKAIAKLSEDDKKDDSKCVDALRKIAPFNTPKGGKKNNVSVVGYEYSDEMVMAYVVAARKELNIK